MSSDTLPRLLNSVIPYLARNAVVVDTTSAKCKIEQYYDEALQNEKNKIQILSIDPLFRPGTVATSKSVAYFTKNAKQQCKTLISIMGNLGCHMFESTPQEHDFALSIIQVAVHTLVLQFGWTIINANISFNVLLQYSTPPFKLLLFLLHRVVSGVPEVYWDIQCNNIFGRDMRNQLKEQLNQFSSLIDNEQCDEFTSLMKNIKQTTQLEQCSEKQQSIFNEINCILEPYFIQKKINIG